MELIGFTEDAVKQMLEALGVVSIHADNDSCKAKAFVICTLEESLSNSRITINPEEKEVTEDG